MPPAAPPRTVTYRDVELVKVGRWAASTGIEDVTVADLEAILAAAGDQQVDRAPLKIGHVDTRFDGEPALGWVIPTRVGPGRDGVPTLFGNIVDVPQGLADIMPKAFPRRSVEMLREVRTAAGKLYRRALSGLSLLGVTRPAVKGLADIVAMYAEAAGWKIAPYADGVDLVAVHVIDHPDPQAAARFSALEAAALGLAGVDDRRYAAIAALAASAGVTDAAGIRAEELQPCNSDLDVIPAGGPDVPATVTPERLRELLKLEGDADVEKAITGLMEQAAKAEAAGKPPAASQNPPAEPPAPTPPTDPTPPAADSKALEAAMAAAKAAGLTLISEAVLADLKTKAEAGAGAATKLSEKAQEDTINAALHAGKIAPADLPKWKAAFATSAETATTLLAALTPAFPVAAFGSDVPDSTPALAEAEVGAWDEWTSSLLPELATRRAASAKS